jgi:hypothetical protein
MINVNDFFCFYISIVIKVKGKGKVVPVLFLSTTPLKAYWGVEV